MRYPLTTNVVAVVLVLGVLLTAIIATILLVRRARRAPAPVDEVADPRTLCSVLTCRCPWTVVVAGRELCDEHALEVRTRRAS